MDNILGPYSKFFCLEDAAQICFHNAYDIMLTRMCCTFCSLCSILFRSVMQEGPYMGEPVKNCFEVEIWASIKETAEVAESFEECVSADEDFMCFEELAIMQSLCK